jgi:hypothetical protein
MLLIAFKLNLNNFHVQQKKQTDVNYNDFKFYIKFSVKEQTYNPDVRSLTINYTKSIGL